MGIVKTVKLPDLGAGGCILIWTFRGLVADERNKPTLLKGYTDYFGDQGEIVLDAVQNTVYTIGRSGGRPLSLSKPGCCCVSADELSIVGVFAACFHNDTARYNAYLDWLMSKDRRQSAKHAIDDAMRLFQQSNIQIDHPPSIATVETFADIKPTHDIVGHA